MIDGSTENPLGLVYTFYSYKGGVGRSMALANVGAVMAAAGHRVLLIDWDLEAPGLEIYFEKSGRLVGDPAKTPGVVDVVEGYGKGAPLDWRNCRLTADVFGHPIDIISAGRRGDDYRQRIQQLDWDTLYRHHNIGNHIDALRNEWRESYDFILVDSRTGITDIGDVCTVILPDVLVLLFVTNFQNIAGIKNVMARAISARSKLPVNRNKLLGVPVPARDERDKEYDKSLEWQRIFAEEFSDLYREWLPHDVAPSDALNRLFIPYVAGWSFGERIPVLESERERLDPTSLGAAYARLATLLSNRLDWTALEETATHAEVANQRVELSHAREVAREAAVRAEQAEQSAREAQLHIETLKSKSTRLRRRAWLGSASVLFVMLGLGALRWWQVTHPSADTLASLMKSPSPVVRAKAVTDLSSLGDQAAAPYASEFVSLLRDPDASVRGSAATAFGSLGTSSTIPRLTEVTGLLRDSNSAVRGSALAAFTYAAAHDPSSAAKFSTEISPLLNDPDQSVRLKTVDALSAIGYFSDNDKSAVQSILEELNDSSAQIRRGAAEKVGAMGPAAVRQFTPQLKALLNDRDPGVRHSAAASLWKFTALREADPRRVATNPSDK